MSRRDASLAPFETIAAALEWQAAERPHALALRFPDDHRALTFGEWWEEASRVASGLRQLGIGRGDHVALLAQNRIEWPVIEAAVALCGAVLVPLNTHFRAEDLGYVIEHSEARVLFLSARFRSHDYLATVRGLKSRLPRLEHLVSLDEAPPECVGYAELGGGGRGAPGVGEEDVAGLLYTSGTTGFPKGALLTHRSMLFDAWSVSRRLGIGPEDRWTSMIPLFHCAGCIMNLLGTLQAGACYVGVPAFDPRHMLEVIAAERCTAFSGVPTAYLAMLECPERSRYPFSSLRTGSCGGADASPDLLRACAREFPMPHLVNLYGQTEASTIITCPAFDDEDRFDTVGPVLEGAELRITDPESGAVLPAGRIGQVQARGPMVMKGYYRHPEASAEVLDAEGWLMTGDLGYLTSRGKLCLSGGRLSDLIIRGGENIYPAEIENRLLLLAAVGEVAVFGVPDRYYGETVAAAVRLRAPASGGELASHCRRVLAEFKVPARWFEVESFPMTASGKIRKVELRAQAAAGTLKEL